MGVSGTAATCSPGPAPGSPWGAKWLMAGAAGLRVAPSGSRHARVCVYMCVGGGRRFQPWESFWEASRPCHVDLASVAQRPDCPQRDVLVVEDDRYFLENVSYRWITA